MGIKRYLMLFCSITLFSFLWLLVQQQSLFHMVNRRWPPSAHNSSGTNGSKPRSETSRTSSLPSLNSLKNAPKCRELFQTGSIRQGNQWATPECKSRIYTWSDLRTCLWQRNSVHTIALIGDSRVRQLRNWFLNYFENTSISSVGRPEHINAISDQPLLNIRIEYFWQPYIDKAATAIINNWIRSIGTNIPDVVIIGIGTWYVKLESEDLPQAASVINRYEAALQSLALLIKELDKLIPVIWLEQGPVDMFRKTGARQLRSITEYNSVTERIFNETGTPLWKSAYTIAMELYSQSPDAMHYSDNATEALVNILWNFYCNSKLADSPDDCCSALPTAHPATNG